MKCPAPERVACQRLPYSSGCGLTRESALAPSPSRQPRSQATARQAVATPRHLPAMATGLRRRYSLPIWPAGKLQQARRNCPSEQPEKHTWNALQACPWYLNTFLNLELFPGENCPGREHPASWNAGTGIGRRAAIRQKSSKRRLTSGRLASVAIFPVIGLLWVTQAQDALYTRTSRIHQDLRCDATGIPCRAEECEVGRRWSPRNCMD